MLTEMPAELLMFLLKFHPKWREYGLLNEALLVELGKFRDDTRFEHHRYAMFRHILETRSGLSDLEIAHYLELTLLDEDEGMAQSARIELLLWKRLTPEQFDHLALLPEYALPLMQKLITRRRLLDRLAASGLTDEIFTECLASRDSTIHETLVTRTDLSWEQLEHLAERGCNRKVRNIAQHCLKFPDKPKSKRNPRLFPRIDPMRLRV